MWNLFKDNSKQNNALTVNYVDKEFFNVDNSQFYILTKDGFVRKNSTYPTYNYDYSLKKITEKKFIEVDDKFEINKISTKTQENNKIFTKTQENNNINDYKDGVTLLYHAILNENIDEIKYLLENNADINLNNRQSYGSYKNLDIRWVDHHDKNSLKLSIDIGNIEIVKLLLKQNADINILLYFAIKKDEVELSKLLLSKGANPNLFNSLGLACINQNLKIVKLLIEYKADTNFTEDDGRTALFDAIEATKANKEIISYLIQNGADIHKEDDKGITPLSFAQTNKKSLVKVLIENEEVVLSENNDSKMVTNYKAITDKIVLQNKVINKLKDEIKAIKSSDKDNQNEVLKLQLDTLKETILSQSNEIKELQNKLISKEESTKDLIEDLTLKINKLEKKFDKQKTVKTKIPLDIYVENKSIKKDDGVIVKRESFDDF